MTLVAGGAARAEVGIGVAVSRSIGRPFNGEKTVRVMAAEVQPKERGGRVLLHLVQWRHQERLDKPALFLALSIIDGKFLPLHLAFLHRKEPVFGIAIW